METIVPADNYDDLKTQFTALRVMYGSKLAQIEVYEKIIKHFNLDRVIQLEAELASEKEMNAILTEELTFKSE